MESKLKINHNLQLEDEQNLWCALRLGDPEALKWLFNKYYKGLFFYGLKLSGNHEHVADILQDVFINIWETRKRISEVTHPKAYLFAALRNNLLKPNPRDIFSRKDTPNSLNPDFGFDISPEEIYLDKESQLENIKIIEDMLADLSPKQKEIIYLKFYCNYSNIEIGKVLSIKQQSVANLLMRTLNLLRKKKKHR
nr:sigma-70 family RNA polymerase sigma factor [Bacteroidota bacterium]